MTDLQALRGEYRWVNAYRRQAYAAGHKQASSVMGRRLAALRRTAPRAHRARLAALSNPYVGEA